MNSECWITEGCMDLSSRVELQAFEHWRTKPSSWSLIPIHSTKAVELAPKLRMAQFRAIAGRRNRRIPRDIAIWIKVRRNSRNLERLIQRTQCKCHNRHTNISAIMYEFDDGADMILGGRYASRSTTYSESEIPGSQHRL